MIYNIENSHGNCKPITYEIDSVGCWVCTSHCCVGSYYPRVGYNGEIYYIHRWVYMQYHNMICLPSSTVIRHTCDNKLCINPAHLIEGSHADNVGDRVRRGRSANGSQNGRSKLTENQVLKIKNNKTLTLTELGKQYRVSHGTVWKIKSGKTWVHIS